MYPPALLNKKRLLLRLILQQTNDISYEGAELRLAYSRLTGGLFKVLPVTLTVDSSVVLALPQSVRITTRETCPQFRGIKQEMLLAKRAKRHNNSVIKQSTYSNKIRIKNNIWDQPFIFTCATEAKTTTEYGFILSVMCRSVKKQKKYYIATIVNISNDNKRYLQLI